MCGKIELEVPFFVIANGSVGFERWREAICLIGALQEHTAVHVGERLLRSCAQLPAFGSQ